jgi:hypothetical protein
MSAEPDEKHNHNGELTLYYGRSNIYVDEDYDELIFKK